MKNIEIRWLINEVTMERRLYYRSLLFTVDASGALTPFGAEWGPWELVIEQTLDEAALEDLIASGGIRGAP